MISIFARHTYLIDNEQTGTFLQRVSSRIRGEEIAQYLEAKLNPTEGFENDVCIYVKPTHLDHIKDGSYVDVLDHKKNVELLKKRPDIKAIAMSLYQYEYLKTYLKNEVLLIPHHHVNFERILRDKKKITTCGYIGPPSSYHYRINNKVKKELAKIGLDFIPLFSFQTRRDIIDYYKKIDLQILGYFNFHTDSPYRHPTKILNAASFGIPTITFPIPGYKEIEGYYVRVKDMDSLVLEAEKMKNNNYYNQWSDKVFKESEKYHIENIAKLYRALK